MEFNCIKGKLTWNGKVNIYRQNQNYIEFELICMGNSFHILIGKNYFGTNIICIPNWNIGSELAAFNDIFWNTEKLTEQLEEVYSITIAKAVFLISETLNFK